MVKVRHSNFHSSSAKKGRRRSLNKLRIELLRRKVVAQMWLHMHPW